MKARFSVAKTAVLVDGGFFTRRYRYVVEGGRDKTPQEVARSLLAGAIEHVRYQSRKGGVHRQLYRMLYYDCPPYKNKSVNPVIGKTVKFAETDLGIL